MSILDIKEFIYTTLSSSASLQTALSSSPTDRRIYPRRPDRDEQFPCVVYSLIDSSENKVPASTATTTIQIDVFSKASQYDADYIASLIKLIMRYLSNESPRVFDTIKINELDDNETDRSVYAKYMRFDIYHRV